MSDAKQCDRCKAFYAKEQGVTLPLDGDKAEVVGILHLVYDVSPKQDFGYAEYHDLCTACLKEAADALP
jgi:hypothetical protein